MDYLSRCYRARIRPYRDSNAEVVIRWYFCAQGARVYPGTHRFGSMVWRPDSPNEPDGPGELFGPKPYDPGYNPGYRGRCHVGPDDWFADGVPIREVHGTPPPLPACCFVQPQSGMGNRGGWTGFTRSFPRDLWGGLGGWAGGTGGGSAAELGDLGGWIGAGGVGEAGLWGGRSGWTADCGRGEAGSWGLLDGQAGEVGTGGSGLWGARGGFTGDPGRGEAGSWGLLGGFRGQNGVGAAGSWGGRSGWTAVCGRGEAGSWGLLGGWQDSATHLNYNGAWGAHGGWKGFSSMYLGHVKQVSAQTITQNTSTAIVWDTVVSDPHGFWSSGSPTRLTVPETGLYLITATWLLQQDAATVFSAAWWKNGALFAAAGQEATNASATGWTASVLMSLSAGDYVEFKVTHAQTTSKATVPASNMPWIQIAFLGPIT